MNKILVAGLATLFLCGAASAARADTSSCRTVEGRSSTFTWCENPATRMSPEARIARLRTEPIRPNAATTPAIPPSVRRDLPDGKASDAAFNWHDVDGDDWMTGVRDQSGCGACFVFGALGALESQFKVVTENPFLDIDLSEQSIISCISWGSCDSGGTAEEVGMRLKKEGVTDEDCYPYLADDGNCDDLCTDWKERRYRVEDWHMSVLPWSDDDIKEQIVQTPMIAQMQVYSDFHGYDGGVYSRSDGADADGWHIVTLVGWDDSDDSWIARNSWGDDWGDGGYFKISRDGDCSITLDGVCFALHVNYFDLNPIEVPGMPCLEETSVTITATEGETGEAEVEVSHCGNAGPVDVAWESDEAWLEADIEDTWLGFDGSTPVSVIGDAATLEPGTYEGKVWFLGGPGTSSDL